MSNMAYCRFQNTLGDLRDCYDNMDETVTTDDESDARKRLIKLCTLISAEYGEEAS